MKTTLHFRHITSTLRKLRRITGGLLAFLLGLGSPFSVSTSMIVGCLWLGIAAESSMASGDDLDDDGIPNNRDDDEDGDGVSNGDDDDTDGDGIKSISVSLIERIVEEAVRPLEHIEVVFGARAPCLAE